MQEPFTIDALPQDELQRQRRNIKGDVALRSAMLGLCLLKGVVGATAVLHIGHTEDGQIVPGVSLEDFSNVFAPTYLAFWTALGAKELLPIRRALQQLRRMTGYTSSRLDKPALPAPQLALGKGV